MQFSSKADEKLFPYFNNESHTRKFKNYSPDSIIRVLDKLGNPHRSYPVFHIAGTNGKGSTAAYIHSLLANEGYRTGLFTSPHLIRIHERIMIDSAIDDTQLAGLIEQIDECASSCGEVLTWFDMLTTAAFLHFENIKADAAVIECGLGGRLDSTNCVIPEISVITEISLDHCHILGGSIEQIAAEKAGIIKQGRPVISSVSSPEALNVIRDHAEKKGSELLVEGRDFSYKDLFNRGIVKKLAQPGSFQEKNFASALISVQRSSFSISADSIYRSASTRIRGRFETICRTPLVIFDPAHNPEAVKKLMEILKNEYGIPVNIFITLMQDKDCVSIISIIQEYGYTINYIDLKDKRQFIPSDMEIIDSDDIEKIVASLSYEGVNLFTGTFRLYSLAGNLPIQK